MSVFFIPGVSEHEQVTVEELRDVAAKRNITIPSKDEGDFLTLLRAADLAVKHVDTLPPYVDHRLAPDGVSGSVGLAKLRPYTKPLQEDNPLNAWSHKCNIELPGAAGPLSGRSVAIKDNMSVAGLPITIGTFAEFLSPEGNFPISEIDASIVKRVLEAGGTVAGTAVCENYSAAALSYSPATGPVHNPWVKGYATGGSSSGCAALLAATLKKKMSQGQNGSMSLDDADWESGIELAIGGDQGGSIRIPAAYSGIYGLKPTFGLCPYTGIASLHPMMDHCGPMATSVDDIAILLSVLAGYDGLDHRMTPETPLREKVKDYLKILTDKAEEMKAKEQWTPHAAGRGLKVGILKEGWQIPTLTDEMASIVRNAADRFLSLGAEVEEVSVPLHMDGPLIWTAATRPKMGPFGTANATPTALGYSLPSLKPPPINQRWLELMSHYNPAMVNVVLSSDYLSSKYHLATSAKAHSHVLQLQAAYDAALEKFDVLITPVTPTVAPAHPPSEYGVMDRIKLAAGNTANTCPFNVTGHPAMSIPVGWGSVTSDGEVIAGKKLPVGMQIIGKRWDEETVLYAASVWEVGGFGLQN
ncbi:hypothetical protein N0V93_004546 [Gnomoniopsis smithogilvyi]|uniref:Amidase domain-containing protein n=1 Tax=Gnomoniopsis smithogilvyi TaxID=1191159 RepID=A0A9W9CVY1_9PEZI|nr:hypothetical protein N0V93_004546 [Gnomoniopsis smithogilvyi]